MTWSRPRPGRPARVPRRLRHAALIADVVEQSGARPDFSDQKKLGPFGANRTESQD